MAHLNENSELNVVKIDMEGSPDQSGEMAGEPESCQGTTLRKKTGNSSSMVSPNLSAKSSHTKKPQSRKSNSRKKYSENTVSDVLQRQVVDSKNSAEAHNVTSKKVIATKRKLTSMQQRKFVNFKIRNKENTNIYPIGETQGECSYTVDSSNSSSEHFSVHSQRSYDGKSLTHNSGSSIHRNPRKGTVPDLQETRKIASHDHFDAEGQKRKPLSRSSLSFKKSQTAVGASATASAGNVGGSKKRATVRYKGRHTKRELSDSSSTSTLSSLSDEKSAIGITKSQCEHIQKKPGITRSGWNMIKYTVSMVRKDSIASIGKKTFLQRFSTRNDNDFDIKNAKAGRVNVGGKQVKTSTSYVISPEGDGMYMWLLVVSLCVMYNFWTIIAREAFTDILSGYEIIWFTADAIVDIIYAVDIAVQMRTGYLEMGLLVCETWPLLLHYVKSRMFIMDILSLTPLDIIQLYIGIHPIVRFPRFIKLYRTFQFMYVVGMQALYPNVWRVANLTHVLFLGAHWFAAFYYLISRAEKHKGQWSYPRPVGQHAPVMRQYLRSLYWATLTLTNIGDMIRPETNWEYSFTIVSYLIGVFIFAAIVGQVGNVISNKNAARGDFERLLDGAKTYMHEHNVPSRLQYRVQRWYNYAWSRGRIGGVGGDMDSLGLLPDKMKTELALHVNLNTLKKVSFFQECEPEFVHDVVLKMKAFIFTPGDMVCRKGEVAREMFIISDGMLEVIADNGMIVARMVSGDFFGEIGILNLSCGINKRSADVRSVGYSELLVLCRTDVLNALKDYPTAEHVLKTCAMNRLKDLKTQPAQLSTSSAMTLSANQLTPDDAVRTVNIQETIATDNTNKTEDRNTSNNNIHTALRHRHVSKVDDILTRWEPLQPLYQNTTVDSVRRWENDPETQLCWESNFEEDINPVCDSSIACDNSSDDSSDGDAPLQPFLGRDEGVTEVEKGVTEVEDVTKVDEETGEDMDELLHNVHILFSDKMKRVHKRYQMKIERLEADIFRKQRRIEELESGEHGNKTT